MKKKKRRRVRDDSTLRVQCPYCFEQMEIFVEADVEGSMVQDCEVCCRPWALYITREDGRVSCSVERAQ